MWHGNKNEFLTIMGISHREYFESGGWTREIDRGNGEKIAKKFEERALLIEQHLDRDWILDK